MKDLNTLTEEELLAEAERILENRKKRKFFRNAFERREQLERDPRAYFTRQQDFERAERRKEGATESVPKFNSIGTLPTRPISTYTVAVTTVLDRTFPILIRENFPIDGEPTYEKLELDETRIPVESTIFVLAEHRSWTFETV